MLKILKKCNFKNNLFEYYLYFLVFFLPVFPKNLGTLFGFIPIRLVLISGLFLIYIYDSIHQKHKLKSTNNIFMVLYSLLLIFMLPGFFFSESKFLYVYTFLKYFVYGGLIFVTFSYKMNKNVIDNVFNSVIYSSFFVSFIGIIQYLLKINLNPNGIYKYPGSIGRIISTFYNPIYLGMFLLIISIIIIYKLLKNDNKRMNFLYYIILFINIIALLLTYTRTVATLLALSIIAFFCFLIINRTNAKKILTKLFIILLFFIISVFSIPGAKYLYSDTMFYFLPENFVYKTLTFTNKYLKTGFDLTIYGFDLKVTESNNDITEDITENKDIKEEISDSENTYNSYEDVSALTRDKFKNISKHVIKDNLIFGIGLGNYENYVKDHSNTYINDRFGYPHNAFLHLTAEGGIFVGIIFIVLTIGSFIYFSLVSVFNKKLSYFVYSIIWINIIILSLYESLFYDTQLCPILLIASVLLIKSSESDDKEKVMFIAGIGGHLTQLLQLNTVFNNYDYILITEKSVVNTSLDKEYKMSYLNHISRNQKILYPLIIVWNCFLSLYYFIKYNPKVIISTGPNTAAAMCCLGKIFGKKVIFIESFAKKETPSITGKWIYRFHAYTTFVVQWKSMLKYYPKAEYWGGIY